MTTLCLQSSETPLTPVRHPPLDPTGHEKKVQGNPCVYEIQYRVRAKRVEKLRGDKDHQPRGVNMVLFLTSEGLVTKLFYFCYFYAFDYF